MNWRRLIWGVNGIMTGFVLTILGQTRDLALPEFSNAGVWIPDQLINSASEFDGILYIGASFREVGPRRGAGRLLNAFSGGAVLSFPTTEGTIHAIESDGRGGVFLAGDFTHVGGIDRMRIVHVLNNQSIDLEWSLEIERITGTGETKDARVYDLILDGEFLYIAGQFNRVDGHLRQNLVRINALGGEVDPDWQADLWIPEERHGSGGYVRDMATDGSHLYCVGSFVKGGNREGFGNTARVELETGEIGSWRPDITDQGEGTVVSAVAVWDSTVFVGGTFTRVNGVPRNRLAALDSGTGALLPWDPLPGDWPTVSALEIGCNRLYVGGTQLGLREVDLAASFELDTLNLTSWAPTFFLPNPSTTGGGVHAFHIEEDRIYIGGDFEGIGNELRPNVGVVDPVRGLPLPWRAEGTDRPTFALELVGGGLAAGGSPTVLGLERPYLAAIDLRTGRPVPGWVAPSGIFEDGVWTLVATEDSVFILEGSSGSAISRIIELDRLDPSKNRLLATVSGYAETLVETDGRLFVGGAFTAIDGEPRRHLAAVRISDGAVLDVPDIQLGGGHVESIAISDDALFFSGEFTSVNGEERRSIAAVSRSTGQLLPWNPGPGGQVRTLLIHDGRLIVSGEFNEIAGFPRPSLASFDLQTGDLEDWSPILAEGSFFGPQNLAAGREDLFVSGEFAPEGKSLGFRLGAIDLVSGDVLDWSPEILPPGDGDFFVHLHSTSLGLVASGRFGNVHGRLGGNLALFGDPTVPYLTRQPGFQLDPEKGEVIVEAEAVGAGELRFLWYRDGALIDQTGEPLLEIGSEEIVVTDQPRVDPLPLAPGESVELRIAIRESEYRLVVENEFGFVESEVFRAPTSFQWRRNGVNIPGRNRETIVVEGNRMVEGGIYDVVVSRLGQALSSDPVLLQFQGQLIPFGTDADDAGEILGLNGTGRGRLENGADRVWIRWRPPARGIATISTLGSSFDTVLHVDSASPVDPERFPQSNDDRAGFLASEISFNALAGESLMIGVSAFAEGLGSDAFELVLGWDLDEDSSENPLPIITTHPSDAKGRIGDEISLGVGVLPEESTYEFQWFRGCFPILGENKPILNVGPLTIADVGTYRIRVRNPESGREIKSNAASIVIVSDLSLPIPRRKVGGGSIEPIQLTMEVSRAAPAFSEGVPPQWVYPNDEGTTQLGEVVEEKVGGKSHWFPFEKKLEEEVFISAIGTVARPIVKVREEFFDPVDIGVPLPVPDGLNAFVRVPGGLSTSQVVIVDSENGVRDTITWAVRIPRNERMAVFPANSVILEGWDLSIGLLGDFNNGNHHIQWWHEGELLPEENQPMLIRKNFLRRNEGIYRLRASSESAPVLELSLEIKIDEAIRVIEAPPMFLLQVSRFQEGIRIHWTPTGDEVRIQQALELGGPWQEIPSNFDQGHLDLDHRKNHHQFFRGVQESVRER